MSLMDNARELKEYQDRARTLSDYELVSKLRNRDYSGVIERAALEQEHRYRTGQDTRSDGPCFITTAVCDSFGKEDDCYELTAFRKFRDKWLINQSDGKSLIDEYYNIAPKIVEKINALSNSAEIYKNIWRDYLSTCLKFIETGDNQQCKKVYTRMVTTLKEKFLQ